MRILMFAINDPAGTAIQFVHAINRHSSHEARLVTLETRYTHSWEKDLHIPDLGPDGLEEVHILMEEADVFHFHMTCDEFCLFGPHRPADFLTGKEVVHHHHGHHDFRSNPASFARRYAERGRVNLLVSTPDLLQLLPQARWQPNLVNIEDPLLKPHPGRFDDFGTLKVCHSPTRKDLKNTDEFLAAVDALARAGTVLDVDLMEDVPNQVCLARKRRSHVLFDHMQGYYGVSSLEGLSQGVAVIAGLDAWNRENIAKFVETDDLPWVIARDSDTLRDRLRELDSDRAYCESVCMKGRDFMETRWSDRIVVQQLVSFYESL